jgi:hypothetical protein
MSGTIVPAVKNPYFTYFQVRKGDGSLDAKIHRTAEQIWNYDGVAIQIQGIMPASAHWGTKTYNCFAKKHLVATSTGGSDAGTKMTNILAKRNVQNAADTHGNRKEEQARLRTAMFEGVPNAAKQGVAKQINTQVTKNYEVFAYGATRTDVCTFVLLNQLSPDEAKRCFARAIQRVTWTEDERKDLDIEFPAACVVTQTNNGQQEKSDTIKVSAVCNSGSGVKTYYVFHCDGAGPVETTWRGIVRYMTNVKTIM